MRFFPKFNKFSKFDDSLFQKLTTKILTQNSKENCWDSAKFFSKNQYKRKNSLALKKTLFLNRNVSILHVVFLVYVGIVLFLRRKVSPLLILEVFCQWKIVSEKVWRICKLVDYSKRSFRKVLEKFLSPNSEFAKEMYRPKTKNPTIFKFLQNSTYFW